MNSPADRIREALRFIPVGGHDERVRVAFMLKSELGEAGRDLWDEWRGDRGDDDAAPVWKSASETGPLKIGSLFHEAKSHGWQDDGMHRKPTAEEVAENRREAAERAVIEKAEASKQRADTAAKATAIWKAAKAAQADHAYLVRKQVSPVATLREIDASAAAGILGYSLKSNGVPLAGLLLVIPVKVGAALSTLELIDGDGRKAALAGRGTKTGGYWAAQPLPAGDGAGLTLLIGEGVATALSGKKGSEHPAIAALSAGNLLKVARAMRERLPAATLILLADLVKATGEPDPHAVEAARAVGGLLAVPDFGADRQPEEKDFNDLVQLRGADAVRQAIAGAAAPAMPEPQPEAESLPAGEAAGEGLPDPCAPKETDAETIKRLAAMSPLEYDRIRKHAAKKLLVRPATLDRMVIAERKDDDGEGMGFPDVEPWTSPVDPGALLSEISATVRRFIICQQETADVVALWVAMTWFMDVVQIAPLAVITAPEKRCGKSQLLFLLGKLSYRPLTASNISPAALFRAVDAWKPTLLVDEADAFMRDNEELRGIINAGHTRDSAYVVRTVGDDFTPTRFSVWGAKALAGIGHLADTLMDRAIVLELRRKLSHENAERLRHAEPELFDTLAEKLARFADDCRDDVRRARPELPASLNDRAQDNWEPLLAIADIAGGVWPTLGRNAAKKLSGADAPTMSTGTELLADIQEVFETAKVDKISTAQLIEALCSEDERPWATYNRGKPISPRQVSKRLGEYGISSTTIRVGLETPKGFRRDMFDEAFSRYLVSTPLPSATTPQASSGADLGVADHSPRCGNVTQSETRKPLRHKACGGVADTGGVSGEVIEVEV